MQFGTKIAVTPASLDSLTENIRRDRGRLETSLADLCPVADTDHPRAKLYEIFASFQSDFESSDCAFPDETAAVPSTLASTRQVQTALRIAHTAAR